MDFGLCEILENITPRTPITGPLLLREWVGTREYAAPEVLIHKPYDGTKVDVWCLGIVLYILLHAKFPFQADWRDSFIVKHGYHPSIQFPFDTLISHEARDLLTKMLSPNPQIRATVDQVLKHPWFYKNHYPLEAISPQ